MSCPPEIRQLLIDLVARDIERCERINSSLLWPHLALLRQAMTLLEREEQQEKHPDRLTMVDVLIVLTVGLWLFMMLVVWPAKP